MSASHEIEHYGHCKECEIHLQFETRIDAEMWVEEHNREKHHKEWIQVQMKEQSAFAWDAGFTEACSQWSMQRVDPDHPITRTNPYK